jgi:hypothetical protein
VKASFHTAESSNHCPREAGGKVLSRNKPEDLPDQSTTFSFRVKGEGFKGFTAFISLGVLTRLHSLSEAVTKNFSL